MKGEGKEKTIHKTTKKGSNSHSENVNILIVALLLTQFLRETFGSGSRVPIDPYVSGYKTSALWHRLQFFVLIVYKQLITFCVVFSILWLGLFFIENYGNECCSTKIA